MPRRTVSAPLEGREPRLRPRIGGRGGQIDPERVPTFRQSMLRRLGSLGLKAAGPRRSSGGRAADVRPPKGAARRVVVKAHFVRMAGAGRKLAALHLAYIERDGVNRDGSAGVLYGSTAGFSRDQLVEEMPAERRQFRFIVSPEDAGELDLQAYTRALVAQMEADLGRRLIWGAVDHWDTDNPHSHVVVRGVDVDGRDLTIDGEYLKRGLRWRAQNLATRELGLRSDQELADLRLRETVQERVTSLDRYLAPLVEVTGRLSLKGVASQSTPLALCLARLETLARLQLASRASASEWVLASGWMEALKELGERNDIIKRMHQAVGASPRLVIVDAEQTFQPFEGVVRRKGLHDELTGEMFAVVDTIGDAPRYVRLPPASFEEVREGDIVRVTGEEVRWVKSADRALQEIAGRHGGVYDPAIHRSDLDRLPRAPGAPTASELVEGNERRLARLKRYGLVAAMPGGRWRVPPDLVRQLEARERTHAQRRVRIQVVAPNLREQIPYPGPTWLDRQVGEPPKLVHPCGRFREEVTIAREQRGRVLASLGIPLGAGEADLLELERLTVGRRLATVQRSSFVPALPDRCSGRLMICAAPSGRQYMAVMDVAGKTTVVFPASSDVKALQGRLVTVIREPQGRLSVTPQTLSIGDPT